MHPNTAESKGNTLTASLDPELFATEDVMQQVLHVERTQAHQALRRLLSCNGSRRHVIFTALESLRCAGRPVLVPEQCRLRASSVAITCMMSPIRSRSMSPNRAGWERMYMARYTMISCVENTQRPPLSGQRLNCYYDRQAEMLKAHLGEDGDADVLTAGFIDESVQLLGRKGTERRRRRGELFRGSIHQPLNVIKTLVFIITYTEMTLSLGSGGKPTVSCL